MQKTCTNAAVQPWLDRDFRREHTEGYVNLPGYTGAPDESGKPVNPDFCASKTGHMGFRAVIEAKYDALSAGTSGGAGGRRNFYLGYPSLPPVHPHSHFLVPPTRCTPAFS